MTKLFSSRLSTLNLLCAALMLLLLVLQFTPFFTCAGTGETVSIQEYVWFPTEHTALEKEIKASIPDHAIDEMVVMPLIVLLCGAAGAVIGLIKSDRIWCSLLSVLCGLAGVWGYLTNLAFHLVSSWSLHLILSVLIALLGCCAVYIGIKNSKTSAQ